MIQRRTRLSPPAKNRVVLQIGNGERCLIQQWKPQRHRNGHVLNSQGLGLDGWIARPLKRHPYVVAAFTKSIKQLVTCNLKERDADLWLFGTLQREQCRKLR